MHCKHSTCFANFGAPEAEAGPSEAEITLVPHEGLVFVGKTSNDKFSITHTLSCEQLALPAGHHWGLTHDEDCFAAATDMTNQEVEPIVVEDMLRFTFTSYTTT